MPVAVVLFAASLHASWNALVKPTSDRLALMAVMGATSFAILHEEPDFGPVSEPMRDIVRSCASPHPRSARVTRPRRRTSRATLRRAAAPS